MQSSKAEAHSVSFHWFIGLSATSLESCVVAFWLAIPLNGQNSIASFWSASCTRPHSTHPPATLPNTTRRLSCWVSVLFVDDWPLRRRAMIPSLSLTTPPIPLRHQPQTAPIPMVLSVGQPSDGRVQREVEGIPWPTRAPLVATLWSSSTLIYWKRPLLESAKSPWSIDTGTVWSGRPPLRWAVFITYSLSRALPNSA